MNYHRRKTHENYDWGSALVLEVDTQSRRIEFIPLVKKENGVQLAEIEKAEIQKKFEKRSRGLQDPKGIKEQYGRFSETMIANYVLAIRGGCKTIVFRAINKLSGYRIGQLLAKRFVKRYGIILLNQNECEAHRELYAEGIRRWS